MKYRPLPHGGENISIIGMGSAVIGAKPQEEIIATVRAALDHGINFFDMGAGHAAVFEAYGKALHDVRSQVYLQVHFGANYVTGEYGWTTNLEEIKRSVAWQMEQLQTDYLDFGFIHCLDEEADLQAYRENGVLDYVLSLKKQGVIRHIGLSTHTPVIANQVLDLGIIDILMFSINPVYDYGQGDYGVGTSEERSQLYARCQREGVAISVMKPYCGGQLLDAAQSPFKAALTPVQCLQYALDQPGVVTVLPGFGSVLELEEGMRYLSATEEERDYSAISAFTPEDARHKCVYCHHCHPCPASLDIALINKYYDLTLLGDNLAREHYLTLEKHAGDCLQCGHCNHRCPFHVDQMARMQEISQYFGQS